MSDSSHRLRFSPEEDKKLLQLVKVLGIHNWMMISSEMKHRTARQCRDRWFNYIDPNLNNQPFTESEDELLLKLYNNLGAKWCEISKYFKRRPANTLRNHYKVIARQNTKKEKKQNMVNNLTESNDELEFLNKIDEVNFQEIEAMYIDPFA